jgi:hypothetical protein
MLSPSKSSQNAHPDFGDILMPPGPTPNIRETMFKMMDHPFWRTMSFVMVTLFGGVCLVAVQALTKLDKLNDAQIETKTMLSVLISQQSKDQGAIKQLSDDVRNVQIKQMQLETMLENNATGINKLGRRP